MLGHHILVALDVSRKDDWVNKVWWNWSGSWIICAGPFGRWFIGILLGFVKFRDNRPRMGSPAASPGYLIEEPHIRVFVTAILALLLSTFALVSGYRRFVGLSLPLSSGNGLHLYREGFEGNHDFGIDNSIFARSPEQFWPASSCLYTTIPELNLG